MKNLIKILLVSAISSEEYASAMHIKQRAHGRIQSHTQQRLRRDEDELLSGRDVANQMYGVAYSLAGIVRDGTESPDLKVQSLSSLLRDEEE